MSRLRFDVVAKGDRHPLTRDDVQHLLSRLYAEVPEIEGLVSALRFGCNFRTTQEGRLAQRGGQYEIRINFCLREGTSRIVSDTDSWLKWVKMCGGRPSLKDKIVRWDEGPAKRYAAFLLFHELAHIVYALRNSSFELGRWRGSPEEERFCDQWAAQSLKGIWNK
jgi:hypothetical protein